MAFLECAKKFDKLCDFLALPRLTVLTHLVVTFYFAYGS